MNLQEFRQQYPQYDDMSDNDLVKGLHEKHYSDIPFEDFSKKIGHTPQQVKSAPTGPQVLSEDDTSSDFMRGISNTLPGIKSTYNAAKVLAGKTLGNKEMMESGVQGMHEAEAQQRVKPSDELTEAWNKGIGSVLTDWLPYQIGSGLGNLAETAAFTGIGAGVGAVTGMGVGAVPGALEGMLAKTLIKKGIKEQAEALIKEGAKDKAEELIKKEAKSTLKTMGVQAGLGGQAIMHGAGETTNRALGELERQGKTAEDLDLGRVLPAAAIHSIADFAAEKFLLQGAKGLNLKGLSQESTGKLFYDVAKAIGTTGAKELLPEEIQTMAERYGASLSLTDAEALKDYINTAGASFAMSIVPGGMGGVRTFMNSAHETSPGNEASGKDSFTGLDKNIEKKVDTLTPEEAAMLNASTDEKGEALAESASVVQNIAKKEDENLIPDSVTQVTPQDAIEAANQYIAGIDGGEKIKQSEYRKIAKALGLTIPIGTTNANGVQMIKDHLAKLGGKDVGTTDTGTDRTSTTISSGVETNNNPTTVKGDQQGGLGGPNITEVQPGAGETTQLNPLDQQSAVQIPPTPEQIAQRQAAIQQTSQQQTAQLQTAFEKDQQEKAAIEAQRQADLQEIAGKTIPQTKTDAELRDEYELSRQALTEKGVQIPAWEDLTADEKDKYLSELKTGETGQGIEQYLAAQGKSLADIKSKEELEAIKKEYRQQAPTVIPAASAFDNAAKALANYIEQKSDTGEGAVSTGQQKVINGYEDSRKAYQRELGIDLPAWGGLSSEAKNAYMGSVKNNTVAEQNAGFTAVAEQLEKEGKGIRGVTRAGIEQLKTRQTSEATHAAAQERIAKEKATEESAQGKGKQVSNEVRTALENSNINGALLGLINSAEGKNITLERGELDEGKAAVRSLIERQSKLTKFVNRFLARALSEITFNSKVVTDTNNEIIQRLEREGKLAEYDPKTDTFYFTKNGFDESTVLHEITHAGTVKLINKFLTDPSSLSQNQREALEHLQKIFDFSKKKLGGKYRNAFENLYEFVTYAMTDSKFQNELANTQVRLLAKYTVGIVKNVWDNITQAFAKLYSLVNAGPTKTQLRPELFEAISKSLTPMDKEGLYEETDEEGITTTDVGEMKFGVETPVKEAKQKYKPGKMFYSMQPGYEGNLLLEVSEILGDILEAPEAGIEVAPLAAAKQGAAGKPKVTKLKTEEKLHGKEGDLFTTEENDPYSVPAKQKPKKISSITKFFTTDPGRRKMATLFQNRSYNAKALQNNMELAEMVNWENDDKINTPWTFITLSNTRAKNLFSRYVAAPRERLEKGIAKLAKAMNSDTDGALSTVHKLLEALHEGERRMVKYILTVPLSDKKVLNNNTLSPAERRNQIVKLLDTKRLTKDQATALRKELDTIASRYASEFSSLLSKGQQGNKDLLNINHERYNVLGVDRNILASRIKAYQENANLKPILDSILANLKELNDVTKMLNKEADYWSDYVDNRVNFYNYDNYAPFRGKSKFNEHSQVDEDLDVGNSKRLGKDLQDKEYGFDGRFTVSDNPVLQTMSEAIRASTRAGRKGLTLSIKNLLAKGKYNPNGQGVIAGVVKDYIAFNERDTDRLNKIPKEKTILHYDDNGGIYVLEINDKAMLDSLRRTYQQTSTLTDWANNITSFFGQLHTRYNYNFAPLNYVRDTLTNAWAIGAELGPVASAKLIGQISAQVAKGGLSKAAKVSYMIEKGRFKELEAYADKDPLIKNMLEFIREGGQTSYLEGISLKSNWDSLDKELGKSRIVKSKEQLDKFMDIYNNMFELSSRAAAYGLMKSNYMTQNMTEEAAKTRAAAFAKNLANFEQVGEWGKAMGAFYMFFRPSATGAVRAIEAVAPAFRSVDSALKDAIGTVSGLAENTEAQETFKRNYMVKKRNAQKMVGVLIGMGMTAYAMAALAADDDDMGRNDVLNDNMDQWTRFARFHLPRWLSEDRTPIQIPWGFGLGAFAAAGAQFASVLSGSQSLKSALSNIFLGISLDSFVPIPVSRMNAVEDPLAFAVDSMMPSTVRPLVEFVMNKNGLGQSIYNDSNRKMGDAYVGGDKVPQVWKDLAVWMANESLGELDISPNSLYFFANSYADGVTRIGELAYGMSQLADGKKEFNVKNDVPLFGSFFGSKSSVDSRQFAKMETEIKEKQRVINEFKTDPYQMARFRAERPMDELVVNYYNKAINQNLNKLRSDANKIRENQSYDPAMKSELLKINQYQQNLVKYQMMNMFEAYGMERPR